MGRFKLKIAYAGADFSGWQKQPNAPSVQEEICTILEKLLRHPVKLVGSGRTDAGVHALGQIAHFDTPSEPCPHKLLVSLNGLLPHTIRILELLPTTPTFHAQISAKSKEYHYRICTDRVMLPLDRGQRWHIRHPLNLELLDQACEMLTGTHDFTSFANVGTVTKSSIRTIYRITRIDEPGGFRLEFEGNGFLYKMVRNLAGALMRVASGKLSLRDVETILGAKDRRQAPMGAPGFGLYLMRVDYPLVENNCPNCPK